MLNKHSPYCTPDIPPQAAIKSPLSISLRSSVHGEWSEMTKSMSRDVRASHRASCEERGKQIQRGSTYCIFSEILEHKSGELGRVRT